MPFDSLPLTNDLIERLEAIHVLLSKERGWIKNMSHDGIEGYCLLGAARKVGLDEDVLAKAFGYKSTKSVAHWNDAKIRTKVQVLERLDKTIAKERVKLFA